MGKDLQKHFSQKEQKFFESIRTYFKPTDRVLKIGNGFGYLSTYIKPVVTELKIYEIHIFEDTINKPDVTIYDGKTIPEPNNSFDVAVFNLVFHHIPHNLEFLKQTAAKTKREIILYEQTYDTFFQKLQLVWRDWYVNIKAGTPSAIYWNSYLKRSKVDDFAAKAGLVVTHRTTVPSHYYFKELIVLTKATNASEY